jgi:tetratricopeptide (TPR) repeat protein
VGFEGLARAALALLIPVGLRGDHTDEAVPVIGFESMPIGVICAVLAGLLTVVAIVRAVRGRAGLFSLTWLATIALAVPAFLVQPAGAALEAPFAYLVALPLLAAAGGVARALWQVGASSASSRSFVFARGALLGALAVIALVGLTHREALGWRDDAAFYERLLDRNPRHVRAMVRLVRAQRRVADELRARATTLPAESAERKVALRLRSEALEASGAWGRRAVRHELGRRSAEAWRELGYTRLERDKTASALRALENARALDPFFQQPLDQQITAARDRRRAIAAELYFAIARCQEALGEGEKAADAYHAAARLEPDDLVYMRRAGSSLCRVGRYAAGLRLLVTVRRRTQDAELGKQLDAIIAGARRSARTLATSLVAEGEARQADGDMRAAVKLYERATEMNPGYARAFIRAGWLRGMWFGGYEIAEANFREAEKLLRDAGAADTDPDLRQLRDFRNELAKQKAEEERDEGK